MDRITVEILKYNNRRFFSFFFFVLFSAFLAGCSGLPDNLTHEFKLMPKRLSDSAALMKTKKEAFDKLSSHSEWNFFSPYLESEKWQEKFLLASDEYNLAKTLFDTKIAPMADRNEPEDAPAFTLLVDEFKKHISASLVAANHADTRIGFLVDVRNTADKKYETAKRQYAKNLSLQRRFTQKANKATKAYSHKKDDLTQRVEGLNKLVADGGSSYAALKTEYHKNTSTNYARFGDAAVALAITTKNIVEYEAKHAKKVGELYRSYVKVLADQRVEYYVVIGRASWCAGEYCGSGNEANFPAVQVDAKVFEYFDTLNDGSVAKYRKSWGSEKLTIHVQQDKWNALRLNPKAGMSRSHSYADYWIQQTYTKTFHKYIEIVNNETKEIPWAVVDEDSFWKNYDNLGMALLTKPYGYYEEDSLKDAQPVGMATVAKPVMRNGVATGSNQYGEWRRSNGHSFFYYYGMYRLFGGFIGPRRYSYNDWNGYSSRRRGYSYYGSNNQYGTYGSRTYSNSRYRNSSYARRNPADVRSAASGVSRSSRSNPSVRGAGSSSRSRGPSGGGK
ncbi:MAG: hypothetical protein QM484_05455 [Woeseiaceae bacterium]